MKPKNVWMKTNGQCTSHTKDQVNGVNLGFASNQKITESYKDVINFYIPFAYYGFRCKQNLFSRIWEL